jgi:hypothetical protein
MTEIAFTIDGRTGWSNTQCPYADFVLKVGSALCAKCKYYDHHNYTCITKEEAYAVFCNCPEDVKFSTFQNK